MSRRCYEAFLANMGRQREEFECKAVEAGEKSPTFGTVGLLLFEHLTTLAALFEGFEPALRLIRGSAVLEVGYVFGDASGSGFGSSWTTKGVIAFRFGIWGREGTDTSSNYREFRNLVETLERMGDKGDLEGRELFIFTDNMVSEAIAAKGSSKSNKLLYELVVHVYKLKMRYKCRIQFIHIAGSRMIAQGSDGLSRGDMYEGVMRGESMLSHVPLHQNAADRSPALLNWIVSWASKFGNEVENLSPTGWFERSHDIDGSGSNSDGIWLPRYRSGTMVWAPPPGVARQEVIEELRQARHKRRKSFHVQRQNTYFGISPFVQA